MLDTYRAADLFVMPSPAEAFGMMAVEAMACGKPVIVFDGTSLPDITNTPRVGLPVPNSDVDALASAIRRLIENKQERFERGIAGRALAEQLAAEGDVTSVELRGRLRDPATLALSYGSGLAVVAILALMVWKPGA